MSRAARNSAVVSAVETLLPAAAAAVATDAAAAAAAPRYISYGLAKKYGEVIMFSDIMVLLKVLMEIYGLTQKTYTSQNLIIGNLWTNVFRKHS